MSFNMFLEMSRRGEGEMEGEASRIPLNFDKDDLEFLEQFPSNYWESAMSLRYHKLHDALIKLHEIRMDMIKKEFPHALDPKSPGHDDAFEEVKKRTENLKKLGLDEEEEFNFKAMARVEKKGLRRYRSKKDYKVKAKPYLNRLYHRLERTRGEPHLPESESENTGIGQYGYDLSYPKTITHDEENKPLAKPKKISRGTNWVGDEQWERDLKNYFQHASHGHFGTHNKVRDQLLGEKDHGIMWMSVGLDDPTYDWTLESIEENILEMKITEYLKAKAKDSGEDSPEERNPVTGVKKRKIRIDSVPASVRDKFEEEAQASAIKIVNEKVERGELFAPKVPGPVLLDDGTIKEEGLSKEERVFRIIEKKDKDGEIGNKIIKPNIYLPHEKKIINGEEKWTPLVKPSTYLKKINSDHSQHEGLSKSLRKKWHDETRPSELPIWTKHEIVDSKTGEPKLSSLEFGPTMGTKTFGPTLNKNTMAQTRTGSLERDKEVEEEYLQTNKFVFQTGKKNAMYAREVETPTDDMVTFDGVKEFLEGIRNAIEGNMSGGASDAVRDLARGQMQDIHQIIYMMAKRTKGADQLETAKGRRLFAATKTSSILQRISRYGLGGEDLGTRRRPNTRTGSLTDTEGGNIDVSSTGERPEAGIRYRHVAPSLWDKHEMLAAAAAELKNIRKSVEMGDPLDAYSEEKQKGERKFYGDIKEKLKNAGKTDEQINAQILSWIQDNVPKTIITAQVEKMSSAPRIGGAVPAPQLSVPKPPDVSRPPALKAPIIGGGLAAYRQRQQEAPDEEAPKLDWNVLSFKSIFEKVEYLKNKLRG